MNSADYPRMMFHRALQPVIIQSEEEEAALGAEWSRTIPQPDPVPVPAGPPLEEPEPGEEEPTEEPRRPGRTPRRPTTNPKPA
jgi:hypothetical protein